MQAVDDAVKTPILNERAELSQKTRRDDASGGPVASRAAGRSTPVALVEEFKKRRGEYRRAGQDGLLKPE